MTWKSPASGSSKKALEHFKSARKDLRDALESAGSFKKIDTDAFEAAIAEFKAGFTA